MHSEKLKIGIWDNEWKNEWKWESVQAYSISTLNVWVKTNKTIGDRHYAFIWKGFRVLRSFLYTYLGCTKFNKQGKYIKRPPKTERPCKKTHSV